MKRKLRYRGQKQCMGELLKSRRCRINGKGFIHKYCERSLNVSITSGILIIVGIFIFILGIYINIFNDVLNEHMERTLHELAKENAAVVEKQIIVDMEALEIAAKFMGKIDSLDRIKFIDSINSSGEMGIFKDIGLAGLDGETITTNFGDLNIADREYFKKALQGETNISNVIVDKLDSKEIIVYATPVYKNKDMVAVLFATNNVEEYSRSLDVNVFQKRGYTHVIQGDGDFIIKSVYKENSGYKNLFEEMSETTLGENDKYLTMNMQEDTKFKKSGIIEVEVENGKRYISYAPMGINDWNVVFIVHKSVVMEKLMNTFHFAFWTFIIFLIVYIGFIVHLIRSNGKKHINIKRLAYIDEVTKHMNYKKMSIEVREILDNAKDKRYAYLVFDIDKFKAINDLYGYDEGSKVLRSILNRIQSVLFYDERIARIYNDKFAVLLRYFDDESLSKRIKDVYERVILYGDIIVSTFVMSTGIYVIEDNSECIDSIRDKANLARKTIKNSHKSSLAFYDEKLVNKILYEQEVTNEMQGALKNGEFKIYMQPKFDMKSKELCSSEALIRWEHPHKGIIPPNRFIPIFEENGFIKELDLYVFEQVCKKFNEWIENGLIPPRVSINLSRVHMFDRYIPEKLEAIAKKYLVNPESIELEITESVVLDKSNDLIYIIEKMKLIGFRIAMDDFGTGYSSLNLLKDLPIDVLKLDKEFLGSSDNSSKGMVVIKDIIVMAKHLDLEVVAEGIETEEQYELLKSMNCDIGQGFLFSKAITMKEYEKLLVENLNVKNMDKSNERD